MIKEIKQESDGSFTLSVNIRLSGNMMEMENEIQRIANEVGRAATLEALHQFDTDGRSIVVENKTHTSKGIQKKNTKRLTGR
jgi:hypothetical protein